LHDFFIVHYFPAFCNALPCSTAPESLRFWEFSLKNRERSCGGADEVLKALPPGSPEIPDFRGALFFAPCPFRNLILHLSRNLAKMSSVKCL
jgi:hypothetical protein